MSHVIKRVQYPFNKVSDSVFKEILHQVACLDSLESYLRENNNILGAR